MSDTIAAVATAPGFAGIAVVRVSGPDAFDVLRALCAAEPSPGRFFFSKIKTLSGEVVDEGVVLSFKAPRSYTGEDVVEFHCHGGTVTPRRVLEACFEAGARMARRGEFTQRAYLNGKLDYEKAEAVLDLVESKTSGAADDALSRLNGSHRARIAQVYTRALSLSTELEHALDVDESDISPEFLSSTAKALEELKADVDGLLLNAKRGRLMRDGALVVIAGPPNAGKSSLLNALLCEKRAIVSSIAGTTRDTIEEWVDMDGYPVRLADTAGIRSCTDEIEAEGVERAKDLLERADVVIALDFDFPGALAVHSKCDLGRGEGLNVSSLTGEGIDLLRAEIARRVSLVEPAADSRSVDMLHAAARALDFVPGDPVITANAVRASAETLGRLVGAEYSSDMLDRLFSRFCVGK